MKNKYETSYKEYSRKRLSKRYKNPDVLPTIDAKMSEIERIAMGRFKWEGIDGNGIALSRKVEEYLFYFRKCAIVETNEVGLAVTKLTPIGVNVYGEPAGYDILTSNGVKLTPAIEREPGLDGQIGQDNAIILTDSQIPGRGCIDGVWHWITHFAEAQISINQQLINQRSPLVGITKHKGDEPFARVEILDIASGINALVIDEEYAENIKPLMLESQFNIDKINAMQHEYISRALNSLGVDSMQSFGKKERMIVDEVESNDESLAMILSDCLAARNKPLYNNTTASYYGIKCSLAKPVRISSYRENLIDYEEATISAAQDESDKNSLDGEVDTDEYRT